MRKKNLGRILLFLFVCSKGWGSADFLFDSSSVNKRPLTFLEKDLIESDKKRLGQILKRLDFQNLEDMIQKNLSLDQQAIEQAIAQQSPSISKDFHYIWVGGPLYQEYWQGICHLAMLLKKGKYPGKVNIWVDKPSNLDWLSVKQTPGRRLKVFNESMQFYQKVFTVRNISDLKSQVPDFLTPRQHTEYWNIINFELHGLQNLAAASDYLRLEILRQQGGIYLDTDIVCLLFNGQHSSASSLEAKPDFKIINLNNSFIISPPAHPVVNTAVRYGVVNYLKYFLRIQDKRRTDKPLYHLGQKTTSLEDKEINTRFNLTIVASGPGLLHLPILQRLSYQDLRKMCLVLTKVTPKFSLPLQGSDYETIKMLVESGVFDEIESKNLKKIRNMITKGSDSQSIQNTNIFLNSVFGLFIDFIDAGDIDLNQIKFLVSFTTGILGQIITETPLIVHQQSLQGHYLNKLTELEKELNSYKPRTPYRSGRKDIQIVKKSIEFIRYHLQGVLLFMGNSWVKNKNFTKDVKVITLENGLSFLYNCDNSWMGEPYKYPAFDNEFRLYSAQHKIPVNKHQPISIHQASIQHLMSIIESCLVNKTSL